MRAAFMYEQAIGHGCHKSFSAGGSMETVPQGLKRLRKNSGLGEKHTSGAKARDDYMTSMPGINPRPTLKQSFSAVVYAGDKSPAYPKTEFFRKL